MITLIKNAHLFAPEDMGINDLLIAGNKIAQIAPNIDLTGIDFDTVDVEGRSVVPGLVDTLVHVTGGGGELGFASRTPEIMSNEIIAAGVTSLVGALGTDSVSRSLSDLYGKTMQLRGDGINAHMHAGSYHVPAKTLTGSIQQDLILIDPVIGVGELAISDHRGSHPTVHELARLASDVKVGAMIAGKQGVMSIHVGDHSDGLEPLFSVIQNHGIRPDIFYPTHISRNDQLLEQGVKFANMGGIIDITTSTDEGIIAMGEIRPELAALQLLDSGISHHNISMSSDGQGSLPCFNSNLEVIGLTIGKVGSLWQTVSTLIRNHNVMPEVALALATSNPARAVGIKAGSIAVGENASLLVVDDWLSISSVMSNGKWLMRDDRLTNFSLFSEGE